LYSRAEISHVATEERDDAPRLRPIVVEARRRGVPMAVIAKWLGHADASITARIYAHSQDDALRAASATLGQVVAPGG
jgi:integrase